MIREKVRDAQSGYLMIVVLLIAQIFFGFAFLVAIGSPTSSKPRPPAFIADITRSATNCVGVPVPPTQLQNRG